MGLYFILFYFMCLLYLNYVLKKKKLCTQNNLSNTLKYENVLVLLLFFLHSRFECKVNTEQKRKKMKSECTTF